MKIGILGGSFNPITNLHLLTAEIVMDELKLDKVYFEPVNRLYEKKGLIPEVHRYIMCSKAINQFNNKNIKLGVYEIEQDHIVKTYELAKHYKDTYNSDIYVIMGADNLEAFDKWRKIEGELVEELFSEMKIVAVSRNGYNEQEVINNSEFLTKYKENIELIEFPVVNNISSTIIRDRIKNKKTIKGLVPNNVDEYIKKKELYNGDI